MNRRSLLTGFVATAAGLLVPEPRRVYSFLWEREATTAAAMRRLRPYILNMREWDVAALKLSLDAISKLGHVLILPHNVEVKCAAC